MECREPGAIRNEELFAYLAGEKVRPAVVQHLASCQRCSSELASYQRMDLQLINKLYRLGCPSNLVLGEYQLGILSSEQAAEIKHHLSKCVLCTAEVATLTEFLANDPMLVERASATPQRVSVRSSSPNNHRSGEEAKRLLEHVREQASAGVRRIVATLVPPQPRLAFQRDATQQAALWPRRYTAEDVNISIQVERGTNRRDLLQLIGFVTRKGTALETLQGTTVQLSGQANAVYTQSIDELGNFVFSSIAPATYTLELQFPEGIVVIDQLPVNPQE